MATITVDVQDAQRQLADLIEQVAEGAEIILTEGDQPRARLVAIMPSTQRRIPGLHPGSMAASPDFDAPLPDDFWSGTE